MAESRLITTYLSRTRRALEWHPDAELIVAELEDHLHQSAQNRSVPEAIVAMGTPVEVARSWAMTPYGGLAVPTRWTRAAGMSGLVAAVFWLVSALTSFIGLGNLLVPWSQAGYVLWSSITIVAVVASVGMLGGAMLRGGGRRDPMTMGLATLGAVIVAASVITWAWIVMFLPLAVATWMVHRRLRGTAVVGPGWLAAGWPLASVVVLLGEWVAIGPVDVAGGNPFGQGVGYCLGAVVCAVMTASLGARLWRERPVAFG